MVQQFKLALGKRGNGSPRSDEARSKALAGHLRRAYPGGNQSERPQVGSGDAGGGHETVCG